MTFPFPFSNSGRRRAVPRPRGKTEADPAAPLHGRLPAHGPKVGPRAALPFLVRSSYKFGRAVLARGPLHSPLGMVLFVLSRISELSIERTTMAVLPWLIPLLGSLIAITLIPGFVLRLPRTFGMLKKRS